MCICCVSLSNSRANHRQVTSFWTRSTDKPPISVWETLPVRYCYLHADEQWVLPKQKQHMFCEFWNKVLFTCIYKKDVTDTFIYKHFGFHTDWTLLLSHSFSFFHSLDSLLQDKLMTGWELKLQINNRKPFTYKFERNFTLKAGEGLTVSLRY